MRNEYHSSYKPQSHIKLPLLIGSRGFKCFPDLIRSRLIYLGTGPSGATNIHPIIRPSSYSQHVHAIMGGCDISLCDS